MSVLPRCILAAMIVGVAIAATIGTLQYIRFERCLATQSILKEGTTRPDQLTESFAQRFLFTRYLNLTGDLTVAQRERFWIGNWPAFGTSLLSDLAEWVALIGGLACAFTLCPVLVAATKPSFGRAFALSDRASRRSALAAVIWQTTRHVSWIVIVCTPIAWWLMSDRYAGQTAYQQWPKIRFGPVGVNGVWLILAIAAYWSIGLAYIFARRAAFQRSKDSGLCAECGYDCTGLSVCPECGLTVGRWAPAGRSNSRDKRVIVILVAAFCTGVGILAVVLGRPDSHGMRWFFFQPAQSASPLIFARPSEVLEIRCGGETFLIAWRVEFLPPIGRHAVPDSVVSAMLKRGSESEPAAAATVERALSSVFGSVGALPYRLNIPSGCAQLGAPIGPLDAKAEEEFENSMVMIEFVGVTEVRRWDAQSDDPRVRRVVTALELVPPGTGPATPTEEESRTGE